MKKTLIITIGIILSIIIVLSIIFFLLLSSLNREKIKEVVEKEVEKQSGYSLKMGETGIHLLFPTAITIKDIRVRQNNRPLANIGKLYLHISPFDLILKRITFKKITIQNAYITIRDENLRYINEKFVKSEDIKKKKKRRKNGDGKPLELSIEKFNLKNFNLDFDSDSLSMDIKIERMDETVSMKDEILKIKGKFYIKNKKYLQNNRLKVKNNLTFYMDKEALKIRELSLSPLSITTRGDVDFKRKNLSLYIKTGKLDINRWFEFLKSLLKIEEDITTGGRVSVKVNVKGPFSHPDKLMIRGNGVIKGGMLKIEKYKILSHVRGDILFTGKDIRVSEFKGELMKSKFSISGKMENFKDPKVDLNIKLNVDPSFVSVFTDDVKLKGEGNASIKVKGRVSGIPEELPYISGNLNMRGVRMWIEGLPNPFNFENLKVKILNNKAYINFLKFYIVKTSGRVKGEMDISDILNPYFDIKLTSSMVDIEDFIPKTHKGKTKKKTKRRTHTKRKSIKKVDIPVSGSFTLNVKKLKYKKFEFSNIRGEGNMRRGLLQLSNFTATSFKGRVSGSGYIDLSVSPIKYAIESTGENIRVEEGLDVIAGFKNMKGSGNFKVVASGMGFEDEDIKYELKSNGSLFMKEGEFINWPFVVKVLSFLGLSTPQHWEFNDFEMFYRLENGRIHLPHQSFKTGSGVWDIEGFFDVNGNIDLKIDYIPESKFVNILKKRFPILSSISGMEIYIPLIIRGTFKNPMISLNKEKIKKEAEKRVEEKIKEEVKKKKEEIEKEIEKKKEEVKKRIEKEVEKKKEELKEKAKETIKNLLRGGG